MQIQLIWRALPAVLQRLTLTSSLACIALAEKRQSTCCRDHACPPGNMQGGLLNRNICSSSSSALHSLSCKLAHLQQALRKAFARHAQS